MSRKKITIDQNTISGSADAIIDHLQSVTDELTERDRSVIIMGATLKDDFCNYSYKIIHGPGLGDTHGVKGSNIILDDMRKAFATFNVHMAVIDDVYKHSDIQFEDVDKMHGDDLALLYHCTGFKMYGDEENESVVLIGNKYVSIGGRQEMETPRIALDSLSGYKWYNELKAAIEIARHEVALYREGKYEIPEVDETPNPKQTKLKFQPALDEETEEKTDITEE